MRWWLVLSLVVPVTAQLVALHAHYKQWSTCDIVSFEGFNQTKTIIGNVSTGAWFGLSDNVACADHQKGVYYFDGNNGLYALQVASGSSTLDLIAKVYDTLGTTYFVMWDLDLSPDGMRLWAAAAVTKNWPFGSTQVGVYTFDVKTGANQTVFMSTPLQTSDPFPSGVLDLDTDTYYLTYQDIYGSGLHYFTFVINCTTLSIIKALNNTGLANAEYDGVTKSFIRMGTNQLERINPKTLEITPYGQQLPFGLEMLQGITLDVHGRVLYGVFTPSIQSKFDFVAAVDLDTGAVLKQLYVNNLGSPIVDLCWV